MDALTILNISDLQLSRARLASFERVFGAFLDDLRARKERGAPMPDLVCCVGDLAWSGQADEYELVEERALLPLLERLGLGKDRLFVVPGNHDVDRSALDPYAEAGYQHRLRVAAEVDALLLDPKTRARAMERLRHYDDFARRFFGPLVGDQDPLFGWARRVEIRGQAVGVACLNSAWRCADDGDKNGGLSNLWVGAAQRQRAWEAVEGADLKVALLHHPFSILHPQEQTEAEAWCLGRFDLTLHGHFKEARLGAARARGGARFLLPGHGLAGVGPWGYSVVSHAPRGEPLVEDRSYDPSRASFEALPTRVGRWGGASQGGPVPATGLDHLSLTQFRCFESLEVDLDPRVTLLIGPNGAGKSALLEAAALAVARFIKPLQDTGLAPSEGTVRRVARLHQGLLDIQAQPPMRVESQLRWDGHGASVALEWPASEAAEPQAPWAQTRSLQLLLGDGGASLPVFGVYKPPRDVNGLDQFAQEFVSSLVQGSFKDKRQRAYLLQLIQRQEIFNWIKQQAQVERQDRAPSPHLRAIERAVCSCISHEGWIAERFYFDLRHDELRIAWRDGQAQGATSFANLSDGYKRIVGIVADAAWRAAVLNPHLGEDAAAESQGILLIDELDLHLHPAWQSRVLGDLRRTFPNMQLIATTHAPAIIASASPESLRILTTDGRVETVEHSAGLDVNSVLERIQGAPSRPRWMVEKLDQLARVLDAASDDATKLGEARALMAEVRQTLGEDDPTAQGLAWELRSVEAAHEGDDAQG
jgi:predicted ATP-binding protein involved in virulence/calcineurin-like phosphoesterase family protein